MLAPLPQHEYEIQAVLEYNFMRLGGRRPAYGSIVGSGQNGTQLHYMKDRGVTKPGDLIVIDAAAEYEGYAADITRTIPVSGTFTPEQRKMYQLVRDAQAAAERNSKPGQVGAGRAGFVGRRTTAWLGRAGPRRERRRDVRSTVAGELRSARRPRANRACSG
jgi:Xaa-Pro aminopeptidase